VPPLPSPIAPGAVAPRRSGGREAVADEGRRRGGRGAVADEGRRSGGHGAGGFASVGLPPCAGDDDERGQEEDEELSHRGLCCVVR
jgi:hypothetical protein